jgi:pyruvate dehydrogenase E1 component beta subunit
MEGDVPEEAYAIPFAEANIVREGGDVTVVATGRMVSLAEQAANALASDGIEVELIDPRTTSPLDEDTILESVENTGRLVVVDEANPRCGLAADIIALVTTQAFGDLKAAPKMVTPPHTPVPFSPILEDAYVPSPDTIADAVRSVAGAPAPA